MMQAHGYGMQQALPPMDQLIHQPIPLQPGYPVNLNLGIMVPPSLQQIYPIILYRAVEAVQVEAGHSHLRILFFNTMAANGYMNQNFAGFVLKLMEMIEIMLAATPNAPVENTIATAAVMFTQYKVALQLEEFPQLQQMFQPPVLAACQKVLFDFRGMMDKLENDAAMMMRAHGQQMPGMMPAGQMGGLASRMPTGYGAQPTNTRSWQGVQQNNPATSAPRTGIESDRFSRNLTNSAPPAPANVSPSHPLAAAVTSNWRGTTPPPPAAPPLPAAKLNNMPQVDIVSVNAVPAPAVQTRTDQRISMIDTVAPSPTSVLDQPSAAAPAQPTAPVVTAPQPPSVSIARQVAYDPNAFEPEMGNGETGTSVTRLKEKKFMDRELHLGKPRQAPAWVKPPSRAEFDQRVAAAKAAEPAGPVIQHIELNPDEGVTPMLDKATAIERTLLAARSNRKENGKITMASIGAFVVKSFPVGEHFQGFMKQLQRQGDYSQIGELLRNAISTFVGDDLTAIIEVNRRLTERINRLITKEMSLPSGSMDDYAADIEALLKYLPERFGSEVLKTFRDQVGTVMFEAAYFMPEDQEEYDVILDTCFSTELPAEKADRPHLLLLGETLLIATVDLNSVELKLDVPSSKNSSALLESNAPFAYQVISTLMTSKLRETCSRVLLRTLDGVILQIDQGTFNEEAIMVSVVQG